MNKRTKQLSSLLAIVAYAFSNHLNADDERLQYQYDAAGNRVSRTVVYQQPHQIQRKDFPIVDVAVSPTITTDVVNIANAIDLDKSSMRFNLISLQGSVLRTGDIKSQHTIISLGDYPSGIYLLRIETESDMETFKIIKQ